MVWGDRAGAGGAQHSSELRAPLPGLPQGLLGLLHHFLLDAGSVTSEELLT